MCAVRNAIEWIWLESHKYNHKATQNEENPNWFREIGKKLSEMEKVEWILGWNEITDDTTQNIFDLELMKSLSCCSLFKKF